MGMGTWWGEDLLYGQAHDGVWACGSASVTYARMREEVEWHRRVLRTCGISAGNTVALLGRPSFTQLWILFALWSLDAQPILFPPRITPEERTAMLDVLRPQYSLTFGNPQRTFADECEVLVRRLSAGRPASTPHCVVQLSSGTTGRVKAMGRTPDSLLAELERFAALPGMPGPGEPVLLLDSWAYSFGLIGGVLHAARHGAPLIMAPRSDPGRLGMAHRPRVVIGTPCLFESLCATTAPALTDLRCAVSGGDLLHLGVFDAFSRRFGVRIGQVYGTTETGALAADLSGRLAHPHVGLPLPGVRTRIVDGVLQVYVGQSPYVSDGDDWPGGWLSTNDLVGRDAATGALRLRGRLTGARGPREPHADPVAIERVLCTHRDVRDAVVIASDTIEALVVADGVSGPELQAWCQHVLGHGHPHVRCTVVGALPRTANGKYVRDRRMVCEAGARR